MTRGRVHLAWRMDRGVPMSADRLLSLVPPRPTVCELGCGNGSFLAQLASRGAKVIGIEPDEQACSAALKHVPVLRGSAEDLPRVLPLGRHDLVIMSHALEHCTDPVAATRNVYALLKPAGFAALAVPNNEAIGLKLAGPAWRWLDVPRHLNFFTAASLRSLCERSGLTIVSTHYDGYCRQFSDEWIREERRISREFGIRERSPWWLLARTAFAKPQHKYDSVWVIARKMQCNHGATVFEVNG